jgi:hypothetical protein
MTGGEDRLGEGGESAHPDPSGALPERLAAARAAVEAILPDAPIDIAEPISSTANPEDRRLIQAFAWGLTELHMTAGHTGQHKFKVDGLNSGTPEPSPGADTVPAADTTPATGHASAVGRAPIEAVSGKPVESRVAPPRVSNDSDGMVVEAHEGDHTASPAVCSDSGETTSSDPIPPSLCETVPIKAEAAEETSPPPPLQTDVNRDQAPASSVSDTESVSGQTEITRPYSGEEKVRQLRGRIPFAARVGTPFEASVEAPADFQATHASGHEAAGLVFESGKAVFQGTPTAAGSYQVTIHGSLDGDCATLAVEIPVNPDPWMLWEDKPSDPEGRFAKPDTDAKTVEGELAMAMARRRGRKHAHVGAYCDDHADMLFDADTGWHVAAVADGAGSASLSRQGSRIAVETALRLVPKALAEHLYPLLEEATLESALSEEGVVAALKESLVEPAVQAVRDIEACARDEAMPPEAFSTTLLIAVARRIADGWFVASFTVGDGLIGLWADDTRSIARMITTDSGEFAGQTHFLRREIFSDGVRQRLHFRRIAEMTALVLMTDGVSDARFPTASAEIDPGNWTRIWRGELAPILLGEVGESGLTDDDAAEAPQAAADLLDWLNFKVPGEHDDRSIVVLYRR